MAQLAAQVMADRAARDAAKMTFDTHYNALKADIDERGVTGRITDEAMEKAKDLFDETILIAQANPAAIGGTLAVLMLWLLRNPLIAWIERAFGPVVEKIKELDIVQD